MGIYIKQELGNGCCRCPVTLHKSGIRIAYLVSSPPWGGLS